MKLTSFVLPFQHRLLQPVLLILLLLSMGVINVTVARSPAYVQAQIEPDAGSWQTWVLDSGSQITLDAPPDEAATAAEIAELMAMAAERDDAALMQIAYWNSGAPSYRWNQIGVDEVVQRAMPHPMGIRALAILHAAIYDATIAAWNQKYAHNRQRPSELDVSLTTVIPNPASPSYPSEYAVTAGAASAVLAYLFPDEAQFFQDKAQEAANSRLLAGVEYPSDVAAGFDLGQQVAELVIARSESDGSTAEWTGSVPTEAGHWSGENPIFPMAGTWKTWVLTSGDQFRPDPPPAYDSEQLASELAEVKSFERTPVTNSKAAYWEFAVGGRRSYQFWNDLASRLILEAGWSNDAPMAARAYALTNIANYEAMVAVWDAKYAYWSIRPFQLDPELTTVFATPNHPSYPSAHSAISTATASVLAYLFPVDSEQLMALAHEASESRIWAGIHFRSDIVGGTALGEDVAGAVIAHAEGDGAG